IAVKTTPSELLLLNSFGINADFTYKGQGCADCQGSGYKGRIGIFEFLEFTPALQELVTKEPSYSLLKKQALAEGMVSLDMDAALKVKDGITSIEELMHIKLSTGQSDVC
ncbi:MAG TPA: hypothetical protein VHA52_10325, partial [Candidatus Babeliaceae bacterium]|nr:hypothetical protein [Candidatus Babeliaceae bacterium]